MPTVICNTPSALIPKELFEEEKIMEYGRVLFSDPCDRIGKDDVGNFFLVYPCKEEGTVHEISVLYQNLQKQFPNLSQAIAVNVYDDGMGILVLKDGGITYSGYFKITVKEDLVYHLANIAQQFFDDVYEIEIYYQNMPLKTVPFLNKYFWMHKLQ